MFERYTEQARRALFFARFEAFQSASAFVETEHILLGLLRDEDSAAVRVLARASVSLEALRRDVEARTARRVRTPMSSADDVPFSEETERALHYTEQEAERLLHPHVGPEHLLLGLFREERGLAAIILTKYGLRLNTVREEIVQMLSGSTALLAGLPFRAVLPTDRERFLRVSPSRLERHEGPIVVTTPQRVTAEGQTLRELVAWAYRADTRHVELPDGLNERERFDARLRLPGPHSWPTLDRLIREGLDRHFGITVIREVRPIDVFVLTATGGPSPGLRAHDDDAGFAGMYASFSTVAFSERAEPLSLEGPDWRNRLHSVGPILLTATTIEDFARWLEDVVGHQVIDSTGLPGTYDIDVKGELQGLEELRQALVEQLALALTRTQREMEVLVVRLKPDTPSH
jgi:uncharacterized protein (TIGR03435 family)